MAKENFAEVKHDFDGEYEFEPDKDSYLLYEQDNMLRFYTMRTDDYKAIGYSMFLLIDSLHIKNQKQGVCQVIFIDKDYRYNAVHFISWIERQLEKEVDMIFFQVKPFLDYSKILKHFGYEHIETTYGRKVKCITEN